MNALLARMTEIRNETRPTEKAAEKRPYAHTPTWVTDPNAAHPVAKRG